MKIKDLPELSRLSDADLYRNYRSWRDGTGIFECYVRSTCFVSLKHYPDFALSRLILRRDTIHRRISACVEAELKQNQENGTKTFFLLDLPAGKVLAESLLLNQDCGLQPVLTLRQLFHPHGIVGGEPEISALLSVGLRLRHSDPKGYLFVLDSSRSLEYDGEPHPKQFNNQYELSAYDLPLLEMLHDAGFTKLVLMHSGALKQDTASYISGMRIGGLNACTIRLDGYESF